MSLSSHNALRFLLVSLSLVTCACNAQKSANAVAAPDVAWVRFQDPGEQAFSLDVPKGWAVHGGLFRKGVLDPRSTVDVTSPDGKINYRIGDANIPPYTVPNQMLAMTGFHEGSPYSPGGRVQGMIARFRSGEQFADLYGQARYSPLCKHLEAKAIRKAAPLYPAGLTENTAGEAFFRCDAASPMVAYVYAETSLTGSLQRGIWGVPVVYSFIAPEPQATFAMKLLTHSLTSFKENPQWVRFQNQLSAQATGQIQKAADESLALVQRRQQQIDQQLRSAQDFDDVINGVTLTRDPETGQQREIWTTQNQYHWINPLGTVVDTPANNSPGANYHKLDTIHR